MALRPSGRVVDIRCAGKVRAPRNFLSRSGCFRAAVVVEPFPLLENLGKESPRVITVDAPARAGTCRICIPMIFVAHGAVPAKVSGSI